MANTNIPHYLVSAATESSDTKDELLLCLVQAIEQQTRAIEATQRPRFITVGEPGDMCIFNLDQIVRISGWDRYEEGNIAGLVVTTTVGTHRLMPAESAELAGKLSALGIEVRI